MMKLRTVLSLVAITVFLHPAYANEPLAGFDTPTSKTERIITVDECDGLLRDLAKRANISLYLEERPVLTPDLATALRTEIGKKGDANWQEVGRILDCECDVRGSYVLLPKSYTRGFDVPVVTTGEYVVLAEDMRKILIPFNPGGSAKSPLDTIDACILRIFATLTPAQSEAMKQGKLEVSSLDGSGRETIRRIVNTLYIPFLSLPPQDTRSRWEVLEAGRIGLGTVGRNDNVFCVERTTEQYGKRYAAFDDRDAAQFKAEDGTMKPFSALRQERPGSITQEPVLGTDTQTLGAFVSDLNKKSGDTVSCPPDFADKPVYVVHGGVAPAPARSQIIALAELYGLRLDEKAVPPAIDRKRIAIPTRMDKVPEAVINRVPPPLRRLLLHRPANLPPPHLRMGRTPLTDSIAYCRAYLRLWYDTEMARLQKKREQNPAGLTPDEETILRDKMIPVTRLDAKAKRALFYTQSESRLRSVADFVWSKGAVPDYVLNWENYRLRGEEYRNADNETRFRLDLLNADGQQTGPGFENVRPEAPE